MMTPVQTIEDKQPMLIKNQIAQQLIPRPTHEARQQHIEAIKTVNRSQDFSPGTFTHFPAAFVPSRPGMHRRKGPVA